MNVNLWFARDDNGEIISVVDSNESNTYVCPICNSDVIPKALTSVKVSPHFAHIDKTKCDSESMLHFWFKYKFIERGDTFTIKTDKEYTFTCKDYSVEKQFNLESGIYRPDLLVTTECGNEIVFEMANTNKKKVQDYIDRWIELDKIIVEVDIKSLQGNEKVFNALYYNGKCFNFNKRDGGYYNTIGKLKEEMKRNDKYDIELVKKLDWFWKDVSSYISYKENLEMLYDSIDYIINKGDKTIQIMIDILNKHKEINILHDFCGHRKNIIRNHIEQNVVKGEDVRINVEYYFSDIYETFNLRIELYSIFKKNDSYFYVRSFCLKNRDSLNNSLLESNITSLLEQYEKDLIDDSLKNLLKINIENKLKTMCNKLRNYISNELITIEFDTEINVLGCTIYFILKRDNNVIKIFNYILEDDLNEDIIFEEISDFLINLKYDFFDDLKKVENIKTINYKKDEVYSSYFVNIKVSYYSDRIAVYLDKVGDRQKVYEFSYFDIYKREHTVLNGEILKTCTKIDSLWEDVKNEIKLSVKNSSNLILCKDCDECISIKEKETEFYLENNLHLPKRCKSCRQKRKQNK